MIFRLILLSSTLLVLARHGYSQPAFGSGLLDFKIQKTLHESQVRSGQLEVTIYMPATSFDTPMVHQSLRRMLQQTVAEAFSFTKQITNPLDETVENQTLLYPKIVLSKLKAFFESEGIDPEILLDHFRAGGTLAVKINARDPNQTTFGPLVSSQPSPAATERKVTVPQKDRVVSGVRGDLGTFKLIPAGMEIKEALRRHTELEVCRISNSGGRLVLLGFDASSNLAALKFLRMKPMSKDPRGTIRRCRSGERVVFDPSLNFTSDVTKDLRRQIYDAILELHEQIR